MSEYFEFIKQPVNPRKRKAPDYSILQFLDGHSSTKEAFNPETCCNRYRFMYYEAPDSVLSFKQDRFNQPSSVAYENIQLSLLKSINSKDICDEIKHTKEVYNGEINGAQFMTESYLLRVLFDKEDKPDCFHDVLTYIKMLPGFQLAMIPNTVGMC